jgi:NAD(P)-dependent dehydrogenase (short-subunit alcohol dehydrogenase family)
MAQALAEAGADVAIVARRQDRLDQATRKLEACGRKVVPLQVDLATAEGAIGAVDRAAEALGGLDIFVTAAGTQLRKPALEVTPEEWDDVVAVNLKAVYFGCQRAAQHMLERPRPANGACRGKIITVASLTAVGAWQDVSVYGMTKGGVVQLMKALALELAAEGIAVNAVGPGTFPTELTEALYADEERTTQMLARLPFGRPGDGDDLAGLTVLLASSASDYITGQVFWVDGGWLIT